MRIAVIGAKGQVGWELVRRASGLNHTVLAWDQEKLDITDANAVDYALSASGADVVINAAAYTAVDKAEQEPERAFAVNREGVIHLAATCQRLSLPLLHISTDYVFDGTKPDPYIESDAVAPLGIYGQSKLAGDQAVQRLLARHLILRVSWVFGIHGNNFVKTMLKLAREREELRVVADQWGCPTYAADIADTLLTLAGRIVEIDKHNTWGTYHYCGTPATTWHGFASAIIGLARRRESLAVRTITAIDTVDYPTPATRPANSVLDSGRITECFGIQPRPWQDGLAALLAAV
ncbi:MAG: dTDP-4-dehydrorhamnose reductase [Candidatus Contendobacter odensis]|uniref:dTDP-4-dehydrorhamnose reductase n=1 Tax=Candidatus Contendibacter odensensis TaxID=1400860 RepID=A0A2G6PE10_9GAMM|nr:MAG: dTDP-4-dehydrorhamnose reductase [Candidatus Contendobacter odensis]